MSNKEDKLLSITDIKNQLNSLDTEELQDEFINSIRNDERKGVINIVSKYDKEKEKKILELIRVKKMHLYENKYSEFQLICGVDEVGRGPLAGPVMAGAVILPKDCIILRVNDSKKLSEKVREELFEEIKEKAIAYAIGTSSPKRIDEINILNATYEAMISAITSLNPLPDLLLNDAVTIPGLSMRQVPIIKGDAKSISIASASILAKVTRDRIMEEYHNIYPEYDFASNKGYGSAKHIEALKKYGKTPIHRETFIKNFI